MDTIFAVKYSFLNYIGIALLVLFLFLNVFKLYCDENNIQGEIFIPEKCFV